MCVCLCVVMVSLVGCAKPEEELKALVYPEAKALSAFTLEDQHGQAITQEALKGQWNLLFLGYTSCPDICPMTLLKLKQVHQTLKAEYPVQVWFISVDPERDNAAKRKQYVDYFNPDFISVSGPHKALFPFVRELGMMYSISDGGSDDYLVDHSASVVLINPEGKIKAIFKPEYEKGKVPTIEVEQIVSEFAIISAL